MATSHDPRQARLLPTAGVRALVALPSHIGGESGHSSRPHVPRISCVTISPSSCSCTSSWTAVPTIGGEDVGPSGPHRGEVIGGGTT
jgi:hypothetical protein